MSVLIQYVANLAPWIYALCGLIALFQLYRAWLVRSERRQAVFTLEREQALGDLYNIFISALLLLLVMGLTYFISTTLSSAVGPLVAIAREPNPTPPSNFIPTPTNTPLPITPFPTHTPAPRVQPTPPPEVTIEIPPTPSPEPVAAPPLLPASCPDGRSVIVSPANGAALGGAISFSGTAQHEQFDYYKLEYAPGANAGQGFAYFAGASSPVANGYLGSLNSPGLANGPYTIRLTVVDKSGNYPQPCDINITVQN